MTGSETTDDPLTEVERLLALIGELVDDTQRKIAELRERG